MDQLLMGQTDNTKVEVQINSTRVILENNSIKEADLTKEMTSINIRKLMKNLRNTKMIISDNYERRIETLTINKKKECGMMISKRSLSSVESLKERFPKFLKKWKE